MKETLTINGRLISIRRSTTQTKNVIVFVHGNSLNKDVFQKQFEGIADVPLISLDLPGHGDSETPSDPTETYSFRGYSDILVKVIESLGLENYTIAGHSLGGHIAINALPRLKSIKGLLIFGTPPLASSNSIGEAFLPNPNFPYLLKDLLTHEEAQQLADSMLLQKSYTESLVHSILNTDPSARASFGASVGRGEVYDEIDILNTSKVPVAVVHGVHDTFVNNTYIEKLGLTTLFENKVQYIDRAGHCPSAEDPHSFNRELLRFHSSLSN